MITYAKKIVKNPLFAGSAVMIFGSNLANFFAYLYHFVVGRLLSEAAYGEVGAILSVLGLLSITMSFLGLVIVKFVASAKEKEVIGVYNWFSHFVTKAGIVLSILIFLASPLIANFLHIQLIKIVFISPIFLFSLYNFLYKSFLQGLLQFDKVVVSTNVELIIRLGIGVLLIIVGMAVLGAVVGIFAGTVINYFLLRFYLRGHRSGKIEVNFSKHKEVFVYALPIFVSAFFSYAIISMDVILVKHFFEAETAGLYTVLSTLGKIAYFASAPVSVVMFPIISKRISQKESYKPVFRLSMLMTLGIVVSVLVVYLLAPNIAIGVLYGAGRYLAGYKLLFWFGVFISLYTLSSQIISYYLSLEITNVVVVIPLAFFAQVIGIYLFHDTLFNVILVSIVVNVAMLTILLFRLIYDKKI